jgi:hypothetical protein
MLVPSIPGLDMPDTRKSLGTPRFGRRAHMFFSKGRRHIFYPEFYFIY